MTSCVYSTAVLAALTVAGCGGGSDGGGEDGSPPQRGGEQARAALEKLDGAATAKRVSALRGLEFKDGAPKVTIVSPEDTKNYVRRQVERNYPDERLEADEAFYQMLGVIPADSGLRELLDKFGTNLILGYYDYKNPDELNMVTNERAAKPKAAESILAHELNHGLQDQNFGIGRFQDIKDPERSIAASALLEGDSQVLELAYNEKHLAGGPKATTDTGDLPPGILLYAIFPYQFGAEFVNDLIKEKDGYELVDKAWRGRPPTTTEQVIHPEKYLSGEEAREVRLQADEVLDDAWKSTGKQSFGELDAIAVLSTKTLREGAAGKAIAQAAEGWDGGARELFTRGDDRALVVATAWETAKDAKEFAAAYWASLKKDRKGKASGGGVEISDVGVASMAIEGRDVTIAIAPDAQLAKQLAGV